MSQEQHEHEQSDETVLHDQVVWSSDAASKPLFKQSLRQSLPPTQLFQRNSGKAESTSPMVSDTNDVSNLLSEYQSVDIVGDIRNELDKARSAPAHATSMSGKKRVRKRALHTDSIQQSVVPRVEHRDYSVSAFAAFVCAVSAVVFSMVPFVCYIAIIFAVFAVMFGCSSLASTGKLGNKRGRVIGILAIPIGILASIPSVVTSYNTTMALNDWMNYPSYVQSSDLARRVDTDDLLGNSTMNPKDFGLGNVSSHKFPKNHQQDSQDSQEQYQVSPQWKASIDRFQEFFDSYIDFVKQYKAAGSPQSERKQYDSRTAQFEEMFGKFRQLQERSNMTEIDLLYYLDAYKRITNNLKTLS